MYPQLHARQWVGEGSGRRGQIAWSVYLEHSLWAVWSSDNFRYTGHTGKVAPQEFCHVY